VSLATGRVLTPAAPARELLVVALNTVPEISAYLTAPDNPSAWDSWPRWARSDYQAGRLGSPATHEYDVLVVLPAGYEPDTVAEGDSLLDKVAEALWPVAEVQTADPIQLTFGTTSAVPALRIRVVPRISA
jgi:hypothetical protein